MKKKKTETGEKKKIRLTEYQKWVCVFILSVISFLSGIAGIVVVLVGNILFS